MSIEELKSSLNINDLVYLPISSGASSVLNRVMRKFYPEKTSYVNSERIVFILSSNQFIDMKNSSLKLTFTPVGGSAAFETGQYTNLFNRVRIVSPTGKVVSDITNANVSNRMNTRLKHSEHYFLQNAKTLGYGFITIADGFSVDMVIPMMDISPFFDNSQLLPPVLSENMSIELYLEDVIKVAKSADMTSYKVDNPQMIIDSVLMRDNIWRTINDMTTEYLVYEFEDLIGEESFISSASTKGEITCTRPISNALELVVTLRDSEKVNEPDADSFYNVNINSYDAQSQNDTVLFRIGDIQLPQQRAIGGAELWNLTQYSLQVLSSKDRNTTGLTPQNYNDGFGCYVMNLRMSKIFNNSGREISNMNSLVASIQYHNEGVAVNAILNMFVRFISRVVIRGGVLDVEN